MRGNRTGRGWAARATLAALCAAAWGAAAAAGAQGAAGNAEAAKRGEYIVKSMGCADCHTPNKMGPNGPEPDPTKWLAGHPAEMTRPPAPPASGPWIASVAATMTAWSGPWGTSFTANLTPDPDTGTGQWTEQQFVDTIRSGRHLGRGREILPPMPWPAIRNMTDADLKAIFAYLRTIPAIKNRVPDPLPPAGAPAAK
jgi:mono/diheme cytochrome c family protein